MRLDMKSMSSACGNASLRVTEVPLTGAQTDEKRTSLLESSEKRITVNTLGDTPAKSKVGHGFPAEASAGTRARLSAMARSPDCYFHVIPVRARAVCVCAVAVTAQKLIADMKTIIHNSATFKILQPRIVKYVAEEARIYGISSLIKIQRPGARLGRERGTVLYLGCHACRFFVWQKNLQQLLYSVRRRRAC